MSVEPWPKGAYMGSGPQFTLDTKSRNGVACIAICGELDMATAPRLEDYLAPYEDDGVSAIILDLRGLTFIDCSGLRELLRAQDRAKTDRHPLILIGASASARRLFEITRTECLLDDEGMAEVLSRFVGSETPRLGRALMAELIVDA